MPKICRKIEKKAFLTDSPCYKNRLRIRITKAIRRFFSRKQAINAITKNGENVPKY